MKPAWREWSVAMTCLAIVLAYLFRESFDPAKVLFSNDAPLGLTSSKAVHDASSFGGIPSGFWHDLNWLGIEMPNAMPGLSWGMFQFFGSPVMNAKFQAPVSLLFLGFAAWILFRTLGFRPIVCLLGGLAAALNMNPFSHATWGLPTRALTWAFALLALAALYSGTKRRPLIKAVLAGMCIGLGIVEGFDVGAMYSIYIGLFGLFLAITHPPSAEGKPAMKRLLAIGAGRVAVLAVAAALFSAQALLTLVSTQIEGVEGLKQDAETREARWDGATAWSLPKMETLRVLIPGLFGYRMDAQEGGNYWGSVGFPAYQRHSGAGEYAGVLVVMIGLWGASNAFRKKGSLYSDSERKIVRFWTGAALVSLLFAWGRWAPFFRLLYELPPFSLFFSTIRNPIKFMHFFHLSLLILFGYGLQLIVKNYLEPAAAKASGLNGQFSRWWAGSNAFDRRFTMVLVAGFAVSLIGLLVYASARIHLEKYLVSVGFPKPMNKEIAAFSFNEVTLFLLFYAAAGGLILACLSGCLSGRRARFAGLLLTVLLAVDLGRANQPWIVYLDHKQIYAPMGVTDFLKKNAIEHRVTTRVAPFSPSYLLGPNLEPIKQVFNDWLQQQFQFNDIQSLDIVQMPRVQEMDAAYRNAFLPTDDTLLPRFARLWELSNTRYILGQKEYLEDLNGRFDPNLRRFRVLTNFDAVLKPGLPANALPGLDKLTWELSPAGRLAIFEFTGALPRYKLFSTWQQMTNDTTTLNTLADLRFDPHRQLLVNDPTVASAALSDAGPGLAQLTSYAPKRIEVKVQASGNSILLWNDRWLPNWKAMVDGTPAKLLRCNYIMRGVQVPEGSHQVVFQYSPPANGLFTSFAALTVGLFLSGFLAFEGRKSG